MQRSKRRMRRGREENERRKKKEKKKLEDGMQSYAGPFSPLQDINTSFRRLTSIAAIDDTGN